MSNRIFLLAFFLLMIPVLNFGQTTCFDDPYIIDHQYKIDNFPDWYPECIETGNDLVIWGDDITNLDGLQQLEIINGALKIYFCPLLTDISGLNNINEIRHNIRIEQNQMLMDFNGLNSLKTIGEGGSVLEIINNSSLTDISGFHSLEEADIGIKVNNNPSLENVSGFPILKRLTNISNPGSIDGSINIQNNQKLLGLDGFIELNMIDGSISIIENGLLSAVEQFPSLDSIKGSLVYNGNEYLKELSGFPELHFVGEEIKLFQNDSLYNLSGFSNLDTLTGNLYLWDNPLLAEVNAFQNLRLIEGNIGFRRLNQLTSFENLNKLKVVKGNFELEGITNLKQIIGLSVLDSIYGSFSIYAGDSLSMLFPENNLKYIGGSLQIGNNKSLTLLSGLNGLDSIGGRLFLQLNNSLENLAGLDSLKSIGGSLILNSNPKLTDISSLSHINPESIIHNTDDYDEEDLLIRYNFKLSDCAIENLCQFLNLTDKIVDVSHNAAGCNNPEEVQENCAESPDCTHLMLPMAFSSNIPINTSISWEPIESADGYRVYLGTKSGEYDIINGLEINGQNTYQPVDVLPCGRTIYVKIVPYHGNSPASSCQEEYFNTESVEAEVSEDFMLCRGDSATLWVQGGDYYSWYPKTAIDQAESAAPLVYPDETTDYFCIASSDNGCKDTVSVLVVVEYIDVQVESITHYSANHTGSIEINILNEGKPYQISWTGPDGFIADTEDLYDLNPGCYQLTISYLMGECKTIKNICVEDLTQTNDLKEGEFYLYPNPTKGIITLCLKPIGNGNHKILAIIYNYQGIQVKALEISAVGNFAIQQIDISDLYPGVYTVQVANGSTHTEYKRLLVY